MSPMMAIWSLPQNRKETPMKNLKRARTTWITNQKSQATKSRCLASLMEFIMNPKTNKRVVCNHFTIHEPLGI